VMNPYPFASLNHFTVPVAIKFHLPHYSRTPQGGRAPPVHVLDRNEVYRVAHHPVWRRTWTEPGPNRPGSDVMFEELERRLAVPLPACTGEGSGDESEPSEPSGELRHEDSWSIEQRDQGLIGSCERAPDP
jgi:hypothetical protein